MDIDEIALHLSRVKWSGPHRFTARCPAHSDNTASLSVTVGDTRILMFCHAGCQFDAVLAAMGMHGSDLKLDGSDRVAGAASGTAMLRLRRLRRKVDPVMFYQVAEVALCPDASQLAAAWVKYPYLMGLEYEKAMTMWHVVKDGPVFEMVRGPGPPRPEWDVERDEAERKLDAEYRRRVA